MMEADPQARSDRDALLAMLGWYRAMGVDDLAQEAAENWIERGDLPPARPPAAHAVAPAAGGSAGPASSADAGRAGSPGPRPSPMPRPSPASDAVTQGSTAGAGRQRGFPSKAPEAAEADAREAAAAASTLQELGEALARFDGCALKTTAKNTCFFRGAERAPVMIIGEAPGRDEDRSGTPFVGRAGQLLDKMLASIDLDETSVHITNVVYWRPPGNRTPTPQEVLVCRPFLERQIALTAPKIIVTVGGPAAKAILDTPQGIMKTRGRWAEFAIAEGSPVRVMPTLHPAYLLRTPAAKRLAWRDLLAVRAALDELG